MPYGVDLTASVKAAVPPFSNVAPKAEGGAPAVGSTQMIPFADHVHPRLTATARGTLDANGDAVVTFTQVFDAEPAVVVISVGAKASGWAIPDFDINFVKDANGKFTGCTIYGRRARRLPTQPLSASPLGALAVLTSVITGVNAIAASITGYDATEPAANAGFSLIAVKTSQVA